MAARAGAQTSPRTESDSTPLDARPQAIFKELQELTIFFLIETGFTSTSNLASELKPAGDGAAKVKVCLPVATYPTTPSSAPTHRRWNLPTDLLHSTALLRMQR